jgi:hypothetical protein
MRFGCEVDAVEAVVIVRKSGIEEDNRDPTPPQMMYYRSDVVGPSFRGHEKTAVIRSRLENHEVRPVRDSGIKAREHTSRGVERPTRIRYQHVIARGSEHLLQNLRIGLFRTDSPTRRVVAPTATTLNGSAQEGLVRKSKACVQTKMVQLSLETLDITDKFKLRLLRETTKYKPNRLAQLGP